MANQEHLDILKQTIAVWKKENMQFPIEEVEKWNQWRVDNPDIIPDLSNAYLSELFLNSADLRCANLSGADLSKTNLAKADLREANLSGANLCETFLYRAILHGANLSGANLNEADLSEADLIGANLSGANLNEADLQWATLSEANLVKANLTGCSIYGISAWNVHLDGATQSNLIITARGEPTITADNLKVAQFLHLLLFNQEIRSIIDTITSKVVLILGRFTPERKQVLDALRDELRNHNYLPVVFDFEKPSSRDFTETVRTLAHLSRFIIADLTDPGSIPQELQAIVPDLEVPVQPLLLEAKQEYSMYVDFRKYHWVLPVSLYKDRASLIASLRDEIIEPADKKARELAIEKAKRLERP